MADFNWQRAGHDDVVQDSMHVRAIAVYRNEVGRVVIRQEADEMDETEPVVVVESENLPKLIARLQNLQRVIDTE